MRADIVQIPDDVWLMTFFWLTPLDLLKLRQTCLHFRNLMLDNDKSTLKMNKYWEYQCQQLWPRLTSKNCPATFRNNFFSLFTTIVLFMLSVLMKIESETVGEIPNSREELKGIVLSTLGERAAEIDKVTMETSVDLLWSMYLNYTKNDESGSVEISEINNKEKLRENFRRRAYNDDITVNMIELLSATHLLSWVIQSDNLMLFQVCLSCYNDHNLASYINKKIKNFPRDDYEEYLLLDVIPCNAYKCAQYLLAPVKISNSINTNINIVAIDTDHDQSSARSGTNSIGTKIQKSETELAMDNIDNWNCDDDDTGSNGKEDIKDAHECRYDINTDRDKGSTIDIYHFPNIDILTPTDDITKGTFVTCAAYYKQSKILSLLVNHPSMTKNMINKADGNGMAPLHYACSEFRYRYPFTYCSDELVEAMECVEVLVSDNRTNINCLNSYGESALVYAVRMQPKAAIFLIQNEKCDVNIPNRNGLTPLQIIISKIEQSEKQLPCVKEAKQQMLQKLLDRKDININHHDLQNCQIYLQSK